MSLTTDRSDPALRVTEASGMQKKYLVLSEEERAKGFVRPVRRSYQHVGLAAPSGLRDLTEEEHEQYDQYGYVKFEPNTDSESSVIGTFWTQERLNKINNGCGIVTKMNRELAETYARDPKFYGATFCAGCHTHLPVGERGEFIWVDGEERVGT